MAEAGIDAAGVVGAVLRRVPAACREIEAADERDRVIDHDDLLVMRRTERMAAVEAEVEARMAAPRAREERERLALERVDHRKIPGEDVDVQLRTTIEQAEQELAERVGQRAPPAVAAEADAAADVPAEDEQRALRALGRVREGREVRGAVDEEGDAWGMCVPPAATSVDGDPGADKRSAIIHERVFGATVSRA